MSETSENICIINAKSGIGTSSPQISQFTHNCDCVKFIVDKDFTNYALIIITSIDGVVSVVNEGAALVKSYNTETKESTVLWYPTGEITALSGCVIYQLAAYDAQTQDTVWYSKEGRLIVSDSIDTTDYSAALVGSSPNLLTQIITLAKALELSVSSLSDTKVDKIEGKELSSNDFTNEAKESLEKAVADIIQNKNLIENRYGALSDIINENKGELIYNSESEKAQSGKAVAQAIAAIVNSAPDTLNTLEELAAALGDDPNFATTIMTLIGSKFDKADGEKLQQNSSELWNECSYLHEAYIVESDKLNSHISNSKNPHSVTKQQIGLGNADNTADIDKPISTAVSKALEGKVDKAEGKGLSSNDFTDEYKMLIEENNYLIGSIGNLNTDTTDNLVDAINETYNLTGDKVDKINAYGLMLLEPTPNSDGEYTWDKAYIGNRPYNDGELQAGSTVQVYSVEGADKIFAKNGVTLLDYGITDAYTKNEVTSIINTAIGEALEADY